MKQKEYRIFAADFETTVDENTNVQTRTEVWASACVELNTEDVRIFGSIEEQYQFFLDLNANVIAYYHNLRFDGNFWLWYLMAKEGYENARDDAGGWYKDWEMPKKSIKYVISDMGQWYSVTVALPNGKTLILRDSLKLMPFSLRQIGKAFGTKHQKLEMEYKGERYAGCVITPQEREYVANDVLVLKEALEFMFSQGHDKLTIGSCCLAEYKESLVDSYDEMFPNLYGMALDNDKYGAPTVGDYIRKSYKGGWCYLVKGKECKEYNGGTTADVNSLYPSVMHSESGSAYPVGKPEFFGSDDFPPEWRFDPEAFQPLPSPTTPGAYGEFWFFRIRTRFYLREGYLPFIQIKGSDLYKSTEMLETSDFIDSHGNAHPTLITPEGEEVDTVVELTLTQTDFVLLREHYALVDYELLDCCRFASTIGIFDAYINKYAEIKKTSKGAMRSLAKLFLNNLYGKMASSTNSSYKVAVLDEDNVISFNEVKANDKKPGYIAVGSAITSYARNFTIRAAQKNYHGKDKPGFIYADTDSIHCDLPPEELVGVPVHPTNFCHWKLESCWDFAWFVRQKTYIEHNVKEDLEDCTPYYNIKCAGMNQKCKELFEKSFDPAVATAINAGETDGYTPEEVEFLSKTRTFKDFRIGLTVPGKLLPKRIEGGVLLVDKYFTMR